MQTTSFESAQVSSAKPATAPRGAFSEPPPPPSVDDADNDQRARAELPDGVIDKRDRA